MIAQDVPLQTEADVLRVARNLLHESRARRVFPTPVDAIVRTAELAIDRGVDLSKADPSFFSRHLPTLQSALRKVVGIFDHRKKVIYLDLAQHGSRQRFITLHETGHGALPWQRDLYVDDDESLDPEVKVEFEREASVFASEVLFQQEVFEDEASALELTFRSPLALSKKFGASVQSTARRYVERSPKRCAALVLNMKAVGEDGIRTRNFFASDSFRRDFGELRWPSVIPSDHAFSREALNYKKIVFARTISLPTAAGETSFLYDLFSNSFYAFAFMRPHGERIRSNTEIKFQ